MHLRIVLTRPLVKTVPREIVALKGDSASLPNASGHARPAATPPGPPHPYAEIRLHIRAISPRTTPMSTSARRKRPWSEK